MFEARPDVMYEKIAADTMMDKAGQGGTHTHTHMGISPKIHDNMRPCILVQITGPVASYAAIWANFYMKQRSRLVRLGKACRAYTGDACCSQEPWRYNGYMKRLISRVDEGRRKPIVSFSSQATSKVSREL